jgi:hypothetical protein
MQSPHVVREGARREVMRDVLGHANIDVTQNVYGKSRAPHPFAILVSPKGWRTAHPSVCPFC